VSGLDHSKWIFLAIAWIFFAVLQLFCCPRDVQVFSVSYILKLFGFTSPFLVTVVTENLDLLLRNT